MHIYIAGWIVGFIVFQTAIVTPTLFKTLDFPQFGVAVRGLWPKFFALTSGSGAALMLALWFADTPSGAQWAIGASTFLSGAICYAIVPATNRATDEGDHKRFKTLHRISVSLTVLTLLANLAFPFA